MATSHSGGRVPIVSRLSAVMVVMGGVFATEKLISYLWGGKEPMLFGTVPMHTIMEFTVGVAFSSVVIREYLSLRDVFVEAKSNKKNEIFPRQKTMETDIVTERYLKKMRPTSFFTACALILFGIVVIRTNDLIASAICIGLGLVAIAHGLLTQLRVARGYFGSNSEEAIELISFIVNQSNKTGHPPGSRVSRPYILHTGAKTLESGVTIPDAGQ